MEICWTSPGKNRAQGQLRRLLGGLLAGIRVLLCVVGPKAAQNPSMSSGDADHGIQGYSHILPQQGHV